MARKNRIKLNKDRAYYHVMSRTINKEFLFDKSIIKEWIYRRITFLASVYYVDLHAITVMSNHYHVVLSIRKPEKIEANLKRRFCRLQAKNKFKKQWSDELIDGWYEKLTDLSEFMKELNQSIARKVKQEENIYGHIFGGRFKSVLIESGVGLLACIAYVEMNPVRARICNLSSQYRWCSSGRFLLGGSRASGVVLPRLSTLPQANDRVRYYAFLRLLERLAKMSKKRLSIDTFVAEPKEFFIGGFSYQTLFEWCFLRTKWLAHSLVLGSRCFCNEMSVKFHLRKKQKTIENGDCLLFWGIYNEKSKMNLIH